MTSQPPTGTLPAGTLFLLGDVDSAADILVMKLRFPY